MPSLVDAALAKAKERRKSLLEKEKRLSSSSEHGGVSSSTSTTTNETVAKKQIVEKPYVGSTRKQPGEQVRNTLSKSPSKAIVEERKSQPIKKKKQVKTIIESVLIEPQPMSPRKKQEQIRRTQTPSKKIMEDTVLDEESSKSESRSPQENRRRSTRKPERTQASPVHFRPTPSKSKNSIQKVQETQAASARTPVQLAMEKAAMKRKAAAEKAKLPAVRASSPQATKGDRRSKRIREDFIEETDASVPLKSGRPKRSRRN